MSKKDKEHLNLVVIGHVDHGKSTMTGRLLYETGAVDERTFQQHKEEAEKLGRPSWAWAFALDRLKEERERGLTIDIAFFKFLTDKYYYTIIDAPGHKDFIKNMITGASQADVGLLVVSAKRGEFEAGVGPGGQTKEHAYLAMTLGVPSLIVCVNKMDDDTVKYSEDRYNEVKEEVGGFLKSIGFKLDKIPFIPTAAIGDACNLKDLSGGCRSLCLRRQFRFRTGVTTTILFDRIVGGAARSTNLLTRLPGLSRFRLTGIAGRRHLAWGLRVTHEIHDIDLARRYCTVLVRACLCRRRGGGRFRLRRGLFLTFCSLST